MIAVGHQHDASVRVRTGSCTGDNSGYRAAFVLVVRGDDCSQDCLCKLCCSAVLMCYWCPVALQYHVTCCLMLKYVTSPFINRTFSPLPMLQSTFETQAEIVAPLAITCMYPTLSQGSSGGFRSPATFMHSAQVRGNCGNYSHARVKPAKHLPQLTPPQPIHMVAQTRTMLCALLQAHSPLVRQTTAVMARTSLASSQHPVQQA